MTPQELLRSVLFVAALACATGNPICNNQQDLEYRLQGQVFCNDAPLASVTVQLGLTPTLSIASQTAVDGTYQFTLNSSLWTTTYTSTGLNYQAYSITLNASSCSAEAVAIVNQYSDQILPRVSRTAEVLVPTGFQTFHAAIASNATFIPGCPASSRVTQQNMTVPVPEIQLTGRTGACGLLGFATSLKPPAQVFTDRAVCGSSGIFAWDQLGSGGTCSNVVGCASSDEACEYYGLGVEWVQQQAVNYPYAVVLPGTYTALEQAQTACVSSSRTGPSAQRCEAVIQRYNPSYGQTTYVLARTLGQASADSTANTYIFHEIGQCSPKVDFDALVSDAIDHHGVLARLHEASNDDHLNGNTM